MLVGVSSTIVGCPLVGGSRPTMTEAEVCDYVQSQLGPTHFYLNSLQRTETTFHVQRAKYVGEVDECGSNCWEVHVAETTVSEGLMGDEWIPMPLSVAKSTSQLYYFDESSHCLGLKD
jgi:hypothetical protein